jgi:hypothetical protein
MRDTCLNIDRVVLCCRPVMQFSASVYLKKSVIWYKYVNCWKPHPVVPDVRNIGLILSLEYFLSIMSSL